MADSPDMRTAGVEAETQPLNNGEAADSARLENFEALSTERKRKVSFDVPSGPAWLGLQCAVDPVSPVVFLTAGLCVLFTFK